MQCNQNVRLAVKRKHETNEPTTVSWNVERMATWCEWGRGGRESICRDILHECTTTQTHRNLSPLFFSFESNSKSHEDEMNWKALFYNAIISIYD